MAVFPAHFSVRDDENTRALDSKLGTVVRCAHALRLQREPANVVDIISADAAGAADRDPDDAVVPDGHGGIRSAAY